MNNEESLINALMDMSKPKAHDNIDSLIQSNQSMPKQAIGPIPEGGLSQQDLLEMIMPFGGATGMLSKIGAGIKHSAAVPKAVDKAGGFLENLTRLLPKNSKHLQRLKRHNLMSPIKKYDDRYLNPVREELFSLLDDAKKYRRTMGKFVQDTRLNQVGEFLKKYMPFN